MGQPERLEDRRLLAFDLVAAYSAADLPFWVKGVNATNMATLAEAPQQITLRFTPGVTIDASTLSGITMRSDGIDDVFGTSDDVSVMPAAGRGIVVVDDAPNGNQVVIRFADTLPDDTYRIHVGGTLSSTAANDFARPFSLDVRLDRGAFVVAVVPQPIERDSLGGLVQARNRIEVHFNGEDPLDPASAVNASFYRLVEMDDTGADVGAALVPDAVSYSAATGKATLTFGTDIPDGKLFRLEIGGSAAGPAVAVVEDAVGNRSSFGGAQALGEVTRDGVSVTGAIAPRPTVSTPVGPIGMPTPPGSLDEPGHRHTPADSGAHGIPFAKVDPATGVATVAYNFQSVIGVDPQGNTLYNVITEAQKLRAREIFELFSRYAGIRFMETADVGLTVATGDLRALDPLVTSAVAGLGGPGVAYMSSSLDWGQSEYGGAWFQVAMHEIGHALGLEHSYDLAAVMAAALSRDPAAPVEPVFPGDHDIVHLRQLAPRTANDIDLYSFTLPESGRLTAQTFIAGLGRPGQPAISFLDSVITLYREDPFTGRRELIARNDDSFGRDSFLELDLDAEATARVAGEDETRPITYYVAVTSTGNTAFDPEVADSGANGRSDGSYELKLGFTPESWLATTIVDATGTPLDGDRDGAAGGLFRFWFRTAAEADTIYVDKANPNGGDGAGTPTDAYTSLAAALDAAQGLVTADPTKRPIVRVAGNVAGPGGTALPYLIGTDFLDQPLPDGETFVVPKGVTVMIDAGAVFKFESAIVDVGSSSQLVDRAGAALQVLGTPDAAVVFTSYHDDSVGGDSDGDGGTAAAGQWGGIVLRQDSDAAAKNAFVNTIGQAEFRYGGGQVLVDGRLQSVAPIQVESTRPTIVFNRITSSAGAAIAATPNAFEDTGDRIGPELRGNVLTGNSTNGLFVKIDTQAGVPLEKLDVPARFTSTDIVYVIQENLVIAGGVGGYFHDGTGPAARRSGRLTIDPGVVVKLEGSRIELERGTSRLIAEGHANQRVIFTGLGDVRYGAGGTFDTNGGLPDVVAAGDWGGIILNAGARASIDQAYLGFGGGVTPIEGRFDAFNVVEVHQGDLRLANSRIEHNAAGTSATTRTGRGANVAATVFVRGAQPIVVGNDFRENAGATVSINANSLSDVHLPDPGRSTGEIGRFAQYADNLGPLVRGNRISGRAGGAGPGAFKIDLEYGQGVTPPIIAAAEAAARRWEAIIVGDLTPVTDSVRGVIDDVVIVIQAGLLGTDVSDGPGGTLANAGPRATRGASDANRFLPYLADVGVDMADLDASGLTTTMIHEFGHALGFPAVSRALALIDGYRYVGANAVREYQVFAPGATFVPLEQGGGSGTTGSHWDESTFDFEILTGWLDPGINPLSRITVGAFDDMGYTVDYSAADPYGLPSSGFVPVQNLHGLQVRGEEITTETVWDDTDIVHVLQSEIVVQNFHTATGVRLVSSTDASLVVKLDGPTAGFTAAGYGLDIDDRIGGTVQVVGQPGRPVILTSLRDDTVGAGVDPLGRTVVDTNADGGLSAPSAGDWRSLQFLPFSNDRNVAIATEAERALTGGTDANNRTTTAQALGVLAPNFATGTNSWESAQEKSGDEIRRLGFEVHGVVSPDAPQDVDVYSFLGYAGSEVWIDIDKTAGSLDAMVELLDAAGNVIARSADSAVEGGVIQGEAVVDLAGGSPVTYQLARGGLLAGTLSGEVVGETATGPFRQTFTFAADGSVTIYDVDGSGMLVSGTVDLATGAVTLDFAEATVASAVTARYSYESGAISTATLGAAYRTLGKDAWRGGDFYAQNPKDPGLRVILPGANPTAQTQYFIRVRSQPRYEATTSAADYEAALRDTTTAGLAKGATSGRYELRVRLRQQDEKPGSTVRYADIRYPTIGIDAQGLPGRSPLLGEAGESNATNDTFATAQYVGNLLQSDRGTISVAGTTAAEGDVDWYSFALNYEQIQSIGGVNDGPYQWATVFDIDYGDGFRGDLTLSVFDDEGVLLYVGRDSNVADDQPGVGQGNDFDDLSRGSLGKLDPFIGTVDLSAGGPTGGGGIESGRPVTPPNPAAQRRYYVAVSSNERLPDVLNATFRGDSTNTLVRLAPLESVRTVVDDRIDFGGRQIIDATDDVSLSLHVTPFTLADVTLFVTTADTLQTVNPLAGGVDYAIAEYDGSTIGDLIMRQDGRMYVYAGLPGVADTAGRLEQVNPGTGARTEIGNDSIPNRPADTTVTQTNLKPTQTLPTAVTTIQLSEPDVLLGSVSGSLQYTGTDTNGDPATGTWTFVSDGAGNLSFTPVDVPPPGLDLPLDAGSRVLGPAGQLSISWDGLLVPANVTVLEVTFNYEPDPETITTDLVDAVAWERTGVGVYANLYYSVRDVVAGDRSRLYRADPATGSAVDTAVYGRVGTGYIQNGGNSLGTVTGMAFLGGTLYGVDTLGSFFTINPGTAAATVIATFAGVNFQGLALGPQNLEGGAFAGLLFAIDAAGTLRALDTTGALQAVFDSDGDGVADATTAGSGVGGATGLAFSPLDVNLWHPTARRSGDPGGGTGEADTKSMYFGFEQYVAGNPPYGGYSGVNGQYGAVSPIWQRELSTNPDYPNSYNLPGGARGLLTTNSFSLAGSVSTDKPTLYFDYWLQTQNASAAPGQMLDAARVYLSDDGGANWTIVATNNAARSAPGNPNRELPTFTSVSAAISSAPNQFVQELFDTANWRQARVDLGAWAGEADLRLRFEFTTADQWATDDRGLDNAYEGFYVDDIVVGFAERGERVLGAAAAETGFFDVRTPVSVDTAEQVLQGAYQLEIRRGTEYSEFDPFGDRIIYQTFDTNDRLVAANAATGLFGPKLGDQNLPREQGQFIVDGNTITAAATYGISIDAGARDPLSDTPHPGTPRNLPTLNGGLLAPGAVVVNNVIAGAGTAGILFSGDGGTGPTAAVPFGRIVNNTVYGGATPQGIGVQVTENAGPTLLNNLFANLATGVSVDASSRLDAAGKQRTVVGTSAYFGTATQVTGTTESLPLVLTGNPFVNAAAGNFYLAANSQAVDSAMNSLQDRDEMVVVTSAIGIGATPILAPDRDRFGQLRGDDPTQPSPSSTAQPGLGGSVFKDRGAVDRIDFTRPRAVLVGPLDQGQFAPADRDRALNAVRLEGADAAGVSQFVLQLSDGGVGIDPTTVVKEAITVTRKVGTASAVTLVEGVDYVFSYQPGTGRIVLESASVFGFGEYAITLAKRAATQGQAGWMTDLANNLVQQTATTGVTSYRIVLVDPPGAPTNLAAVGGDGRATLSWTAATPPASGPITGYVVQRRVAGGAWQTLRLPVAAGATSAVVTGLTNGTPYFFRIAASTAAGIGPYSQPAGPVTPANLPGAPTGLVGTVGDRQVALSWTAPSGAGGTLVDYLVEVSDDGGVNWSLFNDGGGTTPTATVTGLVNGTAYRFRVAAANANGQGAWSPMSAALTPRAVAGVPTGLAGTAGDGQVALSWTAPVDDGGAAITGYRVDHRLASGGAWSTTNAATTSATITGLVNRSAYEFRVAAVNANGVGDFSPAVSRTPLGLAAAPTAVAGVAGDGQVSLTWTAPTDPDAATIVDYDVQFREDVPGSSWTDFADGTSSVAAATVLGLTNGGNYVFRTRAVNDVGAGPWSDQSTAVTPRRLAGQPTGLTATAGSGQVALSWTAPADTGGLPITSYVIRRSADGGTTWQTVSDVDSSATNAVATVPAAAGQTYLFTVAAVTAAGTGAESAPSNPVTLVGPPTAAPTNVTGSSSGGVVTLSWTGVPGETTYRIQYRANAAGSWSTWPRTVTGTTTTIAGLSIRTSYQFQVAAVNAAGAGPYSVPSALIRV